ncbi:MULTISPECIES: DUF896 domain-containing protein [Bacillaceae]|uniref:UPF0291 protein N288_10350 n=2 Tax=Bacillus infantis TaxID=324767 RepID=U5L994_9BACI|nr:MULTISPECIES: DUF896 domain-containing protein [Bacillus]OXT18546.1 DUF896 family protein [Bacillus sp. OG2]AGX03985.1 hypothetical protein N288_10350 [Bacillus infantis NRRL B-14911]EAR63457.1 YnzC [Bacillus sp. NRRL B-14911]MCA1037536.1 DUF896 domain-containing protein [Bacillus infantis]MCK6206316.1 DUF896 domain-containing protein [Bacillus infantis]
MLPKDKMARINELANKAKTAGLTNEEAKEQTKLRSEYLQTFRSNMLTTLKGVTIMDPKGNDVTPKKIKKLREDEKKRLH